MNPSATAVVCVLFLLVGVIAFTDTSGSSGSTDAASLQSLISSVVFTPAGSVGTLSVRSGMYGVLRACFSTYLSMKLLIGLALPLLFHLKSRSANDAPNDAHYKNVRSAIESLPLPCDNAAEVRILFTVETGRGVTNSVPMQGYHERYEEATHSPRELGE